MFIQIVLGFLILTVFILMERVITKFCHTLIHSEKSKAEDVDFLIEAASQETNQFSK